jgi:hypothetical protein
MLVVGCYCWKKTGLWIDDWVVRIEFIRNRRDKNSIKLDKGRNLVC